MTTENHEEMDLKNYLARMWKDYCDMNPQAKEIHQAFISKGETVHNDHIALRTFNHSKLGIKSLAQHFINYGYTDCGEYFFKEKRLYAKHYENKKYPLMPKIFISELELEKMSPFVQETLSQVAEKIPQTQINHEQFVYSGKTWESRFETYSKLAAESEYASWVYAWGHRPNHFTVSVNQLTHLTTLPAINDFITKLGFKLNNSGGVIKGTPEELLEQSSTMANIIGVEFADGIHDIPGCYYEFAKRYQMKNGEYYQGFIAKSADKIFESTNKN